MSGNINRSFKTRIYPTEEQEEYFKRCFGVNRWVWNWALDRYFKSKNMKFDNFEYQKYINNKLKNLDEYSWLFEVNSIVRQESLKDLNFALDRYFKKQKEERKKGFINARKYRPRFKTKKESKNTFKYAKKGSHSIKFYDKKHFRMTTMQYKKPFIVKCAESLKFLENENIDFTYFTISEEEGIYYVSVTYKKTNYKRKRDNSDSVGIDIGVKTPVAIYDSKGNFKVYQLPKNLFKQEKKTKRIQRIFDRKKKNSKEFRRIKRRLQKSYKREQNILLDFRQKITHDIVKNYKNIHFETYSHVGSQNLKNINRSATRFGKYDFVRQLIYKSEEYDCNLVQVKGKATTQTCSNCGHRFYDKEKLTLEDRTYNCPSCNNTMDRDLNAAKNILELKYV